MRRIAFALLIVLVCQPFATRAAKDQWTRVQSKNFLLVGNAGEKDIRRIATKFEQFRQIFARLFPKAQIKGNIPLRVIVFKNREAFVPFMPAYQGKVSEVAGYFQPGQDVHYISLTGEMAGDMPYRTIFHEYSHALLSDNAYQPPTWFNEGLAEFYSTFDVTDGDKKATIGKPIASHIYQLRNTKFVPLARLFAIDHGSAEYNENDKKSIFYAESWALVHYLLLGHEGARQPQFINYLGLLASGKNIGEAFQTAFQTDFATMEKELREYINRSTYPIQQYTADGKFTFDATMESAPLSEAEGQYYLGDLALHLNRTSAEDYLTKAIALDPSLAAAHAALGLAKVRGGKLAEAKKHLQTAASLNAKNYLVHYYYAQALFEEVAGSGTGSRIITNLPAETAETMRAQLKQAIALEPTFSEAYRLLSFVYLMTSENLDEAETLLKRAIELNPGRGELGYSLAQIYMRQQKFEDARAALDALIKYATVPKLREQATSLLESVNRMAAAYTRYAPGQAKPIETVEKEKEGEFKEIAVAPRPALRRRFEGEKAEGLLLKMDCTKGLTITVRGTVKGANETWQFHSATPDRVQFVTYSQDVSAELTCSAFKTPPSVIVTYRYNTDAQAKHDGELIAVEFIKAP